MRLWYSCLTVYFVNFVTVNTEVSLFISCPPSGPIWMRRAEIICSTIKTYHCLYDAIHSNETQDVYVEKCIIPKKYKGVRCVYAGNLDAKPCQENRYSPYPNWSYKSSVCPLAKSLCYEEGQIAVDDGTSSSDRSCRCNYRDGYRYMIKPKDPCRCNPMMEDCSCYNQKCRRNESLSQDYECRIKDVESLLKCDDIQIRRENETDPGLYVTSSNSKNISEDFFLTYTRVGVKKEERHPFIVVLVLVIVMFFSFLVACVVSSSIRSSSFINLLRQMLWENMAVDGHNQSAKQLEDIKGTSGEGEIYCKDLPVVRNYQPTKQLKEITDAFQGDNRKNLVILQGMHGSGKTQAAHKYCEHVKQKYSIIDKISFRKGVSFGDAIKVHLGNNIEYSISDETELTRESVIDKLKKYLNHKRRRWYRYLLLIDNVDVDFRTYYNDIVSFVGLRYDVQNLDIILATTDETFIANFERETLSVVVFNGMEKNEYMALLKVDNTNETYIDKLVDQISAIPLVLVTVAQFMKTIKKDLKTYLDDYGSENSRIFQVLDNFANEEGKMIHGDDYNKSVLVSQEWPLQYLKEKMTKKDNEVIWKVITMLPLLRFDSISSTVLEAIYYHLTKCRWEIKKEKIDHAVQALSEVSLCHIVRSRYARMHSKENDKGKEESRKDRILSFHRVTIKALELFEEIDTSTREENLLFLLKLFCYEIDMNACTDFSVSRNILFISHATKVLHLLEAEAKDDWNENFSELGFYLSYIHCGIGSTHVFRRSKVVDARQHLLIARRISLNIGKENPFSAADLFAFQGIDAKELQIIKKDEDIKPDPKLNETVERLLKHTFSDDFVLNFILEKRRNQNEIDVIRKECGNLKLDVINDHYLSKGDFMKLEKNNLALPITTVTSNILIELVIRILLFHGRSLNELKYTIPDEKSSIYKGLQRDCHAEINTADEYCRLLKKKMGDTEIFGVQKCGKGGRMLRRWNQEKKIINENVKEDISFFKIILKEPTERCFDFGIVKLTEKSSIRHKAMCRRYLLKTIMRKYEESEEKKEVYRDCIDETNTLLHQIHEMNSDKKYTWLALPILYIQCGECLLLGNESNTKEAFKCFDKALSMGTSQDEFLTRCTLDGYKGKVNCLRKLNKNQQALLVTEEVIRLLSYKNLDDTMKIFVEMKNSIENETLENVQVSGKLKDSN